MKKEMIKLTAKQYLDQLQDIDISIDQDVSRLQALRMNATGATGIDYTKDRVMTSPSDRLCGDVCNIMTLDEKITDKIDRFVDARERIIDQIRGLHNPVYNQILYKVYVEYKSLKVVQKETGKSYSFIKKNHSEALQAFDETYHELHYLV